MDRKTLPLAGDRPVARAIAYLRVSSKRQMDTDYDVDADGNSIDTQRKACQDKARQMGVVIAEDGEYVEPGNSAQSIEKRPVFREMLARIIEKRDVDYVIVYMFSRAFRSRLDEAITKNQLQKLGVRIISAKENFGEGPMADAMEGVVAVFNELQVRMNGEDIKVKMANKAKNGGTPGKAKLGYLNVTTNIDGHKVNTVVTDAERRPYIEMAFELYAGGQHTLDTLQRHLSEAGLRTRASGRWPSMPVSRHKLGEMLRDRYYLGYVLYKGAEYQGRHEALIPEELFERVQRVLDSQSGAGTRQRTHHHYLKGLLWCGRCQSRFIVQRATGRHGQEYFYFFCRGRQRNVCDHPYVPVEKMEEAVARHYRSEVRLSEEFRAEVLTRVDEAVATDSSLTETMRDQYAKRMEVLDRKEGYLLDLAAEEGWPKEKLREKIGAIRTERRTIQHSLANAQKQLESGRQVFRMALDLMAEPANAYARADETVRAIMNRTFFVRLHVDGEKVERHELREPFDVLEAVHRRRQTLRADGEGARSAEVDRGGLERVAVYTETGPTLLAENVTGSERETLIDLLALAFGANVSSRTVMVELRGLEPLTPSMRTRCATRLRHNPNRPAGVGRGQE